MSRRGPLPKAKQHQHQPNVPVAKRGDDVQESAFQQDVGSIIRTPAIWPRSLSEPEWRLLDHYVQRFSRTYPAFSTPENPFLSVLLPLAQRNSVLLDALLALSGVQLWEAGSFHLERPMLQLRHSAIQGSVKLLAAITSSEDNQKPNPGSSLRLHIEACRKLPFATSLGRSLASDNFVSLLATCAMLLLYEKLSGGDQGHATPHLQFFAALFPTHTLIALSSGKDDETSQSSPAGHWSGALRFLSSLFLYNDLVHSISSQSPTFSTFYYDGNGPPDSSMPAAYAAHPLAHQPIVQSRFELPRLMARCSAGDTSVTGADIAAWNGRLDWFPSFALEGDRSRLPEVTGSALPIASAVFVSEPLFARLGSFIDTSLFDDNKIISELYRIAAEIYRRQCSLAAPGGGDCQADSFSRMGNLPVWGAQLFRLLPADSSWESSVLWPVGIVARELEYQEDRDFVLRWLTSLEQKFKIRLYHTVRSQLLVYWSNRDWGLDAATRENEGVLCG